MADTEEDKQLAQELTLRAVELCRSDSLGGAVRLELAARTTVLVGKNGAGKSALLEGLRQGFGVTSTMAGDLLNVDPAKFICEFRVAESQVIRYRWEFESTDIEYASGQWKESCERIEPDPRGLWTDQPFAVLRLSYDRPPIILYAARDYAHEFVRTIEQWAMSTRHVPAHIVPHFRESIFISTKMEKNYTHISRLAHRLHDWKNHKPDEFEELLGIGRRIDLLHDIDFIKKYQDDHQDFLAVEVDGVNFGLLSDGTLRAIQILLELIQPGTKLLLIDEPESAAHPGLLARMLAEIEAYSIDRQIVLATQSPQVVSWAQPEAIRLVERKAGVTSVRSLDEATLKRLDRYLHDDDTLGDFIYGGGIDGFTE